MRKGELVKLQLGFHQAPIGLLHLVVRAFADLDRLPPLEAEAVKPELQLGEALSHTGGFFAAPRLPPR